MTWYRSTAEEVNLAKSAYRQRFETVQFTIFQAVTSLFLISSKINKAFNMFSVIAVVFAVVFAIAFAMVVVAAAVSETAASSLDLAVEGPMLYLHPSKHISVLIADPDLMVSTFPLVVLAYAYMSFRTHIGKSLVILTWIVSLFILEAEILSSSIELLQPGVFIAAVVLSAFHLLAFLNIPTIVKIAIGILLQTTGFTFRLTVRVMRMLFRLTCIIMSPLVLHMIQNSNLPAFGLIVIIGSCFGMSWYYLSKKLLHHALHVFEMITDEIASFLVPLPAEEAIDPDFIDQLPPAQEEMPVLPRAAQRLVGDLLDMQKPLTIQWSDGKLSDSVRFRPQYVNGDTKSTDLFTGNRVEGKWLEEHCRGGYGCVLDQLTGLASSVQVVPNRAQEDRGAACRSVYQTLDESYRMQSVARTALRDLRSRYEVFKQRYPRRFGKGSVYQKRLNECRQFEQGLDMIFLDIRMQAEFDPNPALRIVQDTLEEAEMDRLDEEEEASAEEPVFSAEQDIVEEEDEVPIVPKKCRRSQLRREQAALISGLGKYWTSSKPARKLPRRSTRVKREPQRYGFVP